MTALTQMAAAPPGIVDARVPCPLCGGLIHPVAGRCKHCKEDLSSYRAGRPAAAAALPALNGKPVNGSNGHVVATPIPIVVAKHESQPILPPRTTARTVPAQRPHSMWRSWPMLVIAVAVVAIVVATVIMVLPRDDKHGSGKMSAPPAPERMETNPLVPEQHGQLDPWDNDAPGTVPGRPVPVPDPIPPTPAPDPDDDLLGGQGGLGGMQGNAFLFHVVDRACKKLMTCPGGDLSTLNAMCDGFAAMPKPPVPTCDAVKRCFDAIDQMSCTQVDDDVSPLSLYTRFRDCADAIKC
jgi:hypothetical protein